MQQLEQHQIGVGDAVARHERPPAREIRPLQVSLDSLEVLGPIALLVLLVILLLVVGEEGRDEQGPPYIARQQEAFSLSTGSEKDEQSMTMSVMASTQYLSSSVFPS